MKAVRRGQSRQVKLATEAGETLARDGIFAIVVTSEQFTHIAVGERFEKLAPRKEEALERPGKAGRSTRRETRGQDSQLNDAEKFTVAEWYWLKIVGELAEIEERIGKLAKVITEKQSWQVI